MSGPEAPPFPSPTSSIAVGSFEPPSASRAPTSPGAIFLINDLRMGGAERALLNFVNHMERIRPVVVLIDSAADLLGELDTGVELFSLDGRRPAPVPASARPASIPVPGGRRRGRPRGQMLLELPGLVRKARRLARLSATTQCRVISTFLNRSHTIALLSKFLFERRLRIVINVHEMLSDHLDLHFAPLERRVMRAFIRYAFPHAERIVAVSVGVRDDLVRHFSIAVDRITVVHNPIDVSSIRRASAEWSAETFAEEPGRRDPSRECPRPARIVAVGRLVRLKGFDLLIRAFATLPASLRATLLIVGDGEERAALEQLARELLVADRVRLIGTRANPWRYMAGADVVALSSRTEAFPNVIGEALALSLPVVATSCSKGVVEYLDSGRYGLLVPPDDVGALARALERVLTDGQLRRRLVEQAAARAQEFDIPAVVERYENFVAEAMRA